MNPKQKIKHMNENYQNLGNLRKLQATAKANSASCIDVQYQKVGMFVVSALLAARPDCIHLKLAKVDKNQWKQSSSFSDKTGNNSVKSRMEVSICIMQLLCL